MRKIIKILIPITLICSCKYMPGDMNSSMASYVNRNYAKMQALLTWRIFYEPERDFWYCRHMYGNDSILADLTIYVNKNNKVQRYGIRALHENDTIKTINIAVQNINTLNEIRCLKNFDNIGTIPVQLDTLPFDYCINVGKDTTHYQILHAKGHDFTIGKHLSRDWYIRQLSHKEK